MDEVNQTPLPDSTLYRKEQPRYLTERPDGTLHWPDEVEYVPATLKQIAYAHPRCETCVHYNSIKHECLNHSISGYRHPKHYCALHSNHTRTP